MSDYYFHESMVAKMVSSNEYQEGYSVGFASGYNQGRADERAKVIKECKEVLRHYAFKEDDDNMYIKVDDLKQLKEQK